MQSSKCHDDVIVGPFSAGGILAFIVGVFIEYQTRCV